MQAFTEVTGRAAPLMLANVDTDTIIRIDRLTSLPKEALGPYAFESLRFRAEGDEDPGFILNRPEFRGAPLLLADANFGCGSSREGAVWALQAIGLRCVIAPSFGDIFHNNCFQNGMLPIRLPADEVHSLARLAQAGGSFTVDLHRQVVVAPDRSSRPFSIDPMRRQSLLEGLDDIGLTLKEADAIDAWERADVLLRPWNWPPGPGTPEP